MWHCVVHWWFTEKLSIGLITLNILQNPVDNYLKTIEVWFDPFNSFLWGVGTFPGKVDVIPYQNLTRYDKSACVPTTLHHNTTYYSTVVAYNNALNSKPTNSSSDGGIFLKSVLNHLDLNSPNPMLFGKFQCINIITPTLILDPKCQTRTHTHTHIYI